MFSSELKFSSATMKLLHLEQFALYGICTFLLIYFVAILGRWKQKTKNYEIDYELLQIEGEVATGLLHEM